MYSFLVTCIQFWLHVFSFRYMYPAGVLVECAKAPLAGDVLRNHRSAALCLALCKKDDAGGLYCPKPRSPDTAIPALLATVRASMSARISVPQLTSRSTPTEVNRGAGLRPRAAASGFCRGFRAIRCAISAPFQAARRVLFQIVTRSTPAPTRKAALAKPKKWIALPRAIRPHRRLRPWSLIDFQRSRPGVPGARWPVSHM